MGNKAADIFRDLEDNSGYQRAMAAIGIYRPAQAYEYPAQERLEMEVAAPVVSQVQTVAVRKGPNLADVKQNLQKISADLTADAAEVEVDVALMDAGIDSLAMVDLRNRIVDTYVGVKMTNTFLFDHP